MKITCTVEHLRSAVIIAERFVGRHMTIPIISHLFFSVKEKKISVIATNLETGIEYTIPGKIQKTGIVTTPAKQISQILQSIPNNENVTLEASHQKLTLHTTHSDVTLLSLNPDDYPALPVIKHEHQFFIASGLLKEGLAQVAPAVATSDLKPELAGVYFHTTPATLTLAATDSFRLAEKTLSKLEGVKEENSCIVPARTIQELLRTVPSEGEMSVSVGEHQIVFSWDQGRILSRLADGSYPPYKGLLPKAYETTIVVNREELLRNIHLASVFSSRLNDVTIRYSPNELEIETTNTETGGAVSRLDVKGRGASGSVVFNYRYLNDGLNAISGDDVALNLNGVGGPAMIQNPGDASSLYLLMPIRSV